MLARNPASPYRNSHSCAFDWCKHCDFFDCECAPAERSSLRSAETHGSNLCQNHGTAIHTTCEGIIGRRTMGGCCAEHAPSLISAVSHEGLRDESSSGSRCNIFKRDAFRHTISTRWRSIRFLGAISRRTRIVRRGPKTAILSYSLWRTVFWRKSQCPGTSHAAEGEPYTIIGVLPESEPLL